MPATFEFAETQRIGRTGAETETNEELLGLPRELGILCRSVLDVDNTNRKHRRRPTRGCPGLRPKSVHVSRRCAEPQDDAVLAGSVC
jgi:hypothetical protein